MVQVIKSGMQRGRKSMTTEVVVKDYTKCAVAYTLFFFFWRALIGKQIKSPSHGQDHF